jgi:hypothetical protein
MTQYYPFSLPDRVLCALGKECLHAKKKYFQWEYDQQQRQAAGEASGSSGVVSAGTRPEPPKQSRQVLIKTALLSHKNGFLDCGHFCCDTAPPVAYKVASGVRPGVTCKDLHVRCNKTNANRYVYLYWVAIKKNLLPHPPATDNTGLREALEQMEV